MFHLRRPVLLLLLGLALSAALDHPPRAGRVMAATAAAWSYESRVPPFVLFGWVSPPVESTTSERMAEYRGAGLDVALPAWADSGRREDNLARFARAASNGVACIAWDRRLGDVRFGEPGGLAAMDSVVADCRDHPGFLAYYFEDEPPAAHFPMLARYHAALRARDPANFSFNNLLGRGSFPDRAAWEAYVRAYRDTVQPAVLCDDHYDFLRGRDVGLFVENAAGLAAIAREGGLPFWLILQLIEHGHYRALTDGELRWQVGMALAYGARGIGYFTYWTPAPDPTWNWQYGAIGWDGRRTPWFEVLAGLNPRVRRTGLRLAASVWLATEHAGSVPIGGTRFAPDGWVGAVDGRAALGAFAGRAGERLLLVVNADSSAAQTVTLLPADPGAVWRLDHDPPVQLDRDREGRVALPLAPGDFALLHLPGEGAVAAGQPPRLALHPVPARGRLTLAVRDARPGARLEILDATGRRAWGRTLDGAADLEWRGEREAGGVAPPGVYFARVEDTGGVAAARFAWLGR